MFTPRQFIDNPTAVSQGDYALALKANGAEIKGGIIGGSLGTDGQIKITQWDVNCGTSREAGSSLSTGRRNYTPLDMTGPISKAAPLIFKAQAENQKIEATLRLFRANPDGGTREEYMTVKITDGRVANFTLLTSPVDGSLYYNFMITFHKINITWVEGGITHEDTWDQNR